MLLYFLCRLLCNGVYRLFFCDPLDDNVASKHCTQDFFYNLSIKHGDGIYQKLPLCSVHRVHLAHTKEMLIWNIPMTSTEISGVPTYIPRYHIYIIHTILYLYIFLLDFLHNVRIRLCENKKKNCLYIYVFGLLSTVKYEKNVNQNVLGCHLVLHLFFRERDDSIIIY